MSKNSTVSYVRDATLASGLLAVSGYVVDSGTDGGVVARAELPPGAERLWATRESARGLLTIDLEHASIPEAPVLWFVIIPEPRASPPATNLVAFAGDQLEAGTVINNYMFATMGVENSAQAGAVRWYPQTGVVHQVYVAQEWRRKQVGTAVLYAASAFHQANGWPGNLHSDGRRTAIGELFVAGLRHPQRITARDAELPPMDED